MAEHNYLAFDLGARADGRCWASSTAGKLTLEEKHRFANPNGRMNGHLHWNLLAAVGRAENRPAEDVGNDQRSSPASASIRGASISACSARTARCSAIRSMYRDSPHRRHDGTRLREASPRERFSTATGIQFMQLNSLFQLFAMREASSPLLERRRDAAVHARPVQLPLHRRAQERILHRHDQPDVRPAQTATGRRRCSKQLGLPTQILPEIVPSRDGASASCSETSRTSAASSRSR